MTLREQGRFILPVGMRLCDIGTAEVPFSSVQRYAVFALWFESGLDQEALLGRGWICTGHEAVGGWKLPVASEQRRGSEVKLPAVSLIVKSIENDNFPGNF